MGKFDKKVLKYISARQEDDLDLDDIAIGLRLDEDEVREALESLKDQGKIDGAPRNGKTYWRLSILENDLVDDTKESSVRIDPDLAAIDLDQAMSEVKPIQMPMGFEPVDVAKIIERPIATVSTPENNIQDINKLDDDSDPDPRPKLTGSPVVRIAFAVVLSVVISTIVSIIAVNGPQKRLSDDIQTLERKSTETNAKLDTRVAEISAQLSILNDKLSGHQQSKSEQNRLGKPPHPAYKKKVTTKPSSPDENATSEPSSSDLSPPSSTSGHDDNSVPAPAPPASTEGNGESGQ
jgi:hypothetical protein